MQGGLAVKKAAGLEYLEKQPDSGVVRKLAVLLHGYGRDASLMQKLADELSLRVPDILVVMPHGGEPYENPALDTDMVLRVPRQLQGDDPDGLEVTSRRQWFSIRQKTLADMTVGLHRATAQVNDLISELLRAYDLADQDAALMGFSQGGVVALYSAYRRTQGVACVVGHSCLFMGGDDFKSLPPTLYLYGLVDEEFSPERYNREAETLKLYVKDAVIRPVEDLRHTTTAHSRQIVADYMAHHLS